MCYLVWYCEGVFFGVVVICLFFCVGLYVWYSYCQLARVGFTILRKRKKFMLFDQLSRSRLFCGFSLEDWELACIDTPFLSSEARVFVRTWRAVMPHFFLARLAFL
jgi:hypothetical protein